MVLISEPTERCDNSTFGHLRRRSLQTLTGTGDPLRQWGTIWQWKAPCHCIYFKALNTRRRLAFYLKSEAACNGQRQHPTVRGFNCIDALTDTARPMPQRTCRAQGFLIRVCGEGKIFKHQQQLSGTSKVLSFIKRKLLNVF